MIKEKGKQDLEVKIKNISEKLGDKCMKEGERADGKAT